MNSENKGDFVEGFSLTGTEVQGLKNKKFSIIGIPQYIEVNSKWSKEPSRKLIVPIELAENHLKTEWFCNKTSQKKIIDAVGRELKKWVGFQGEFKVVSQMVGTEERPVLYVK